jgi:hypothetical protein
MLFPDAAKSSEVSIAIDPEAGATEYAGLKFHAAAKLAINEEGRLEADREGLNATDTGGTIWTARSLTADSRAPFVFVKKP